MNVDRPPALRNEGEEIAELLLARMRKRQSEYEFVSGNQLSRLFLIFMVRMLGVLVQRIWILMRVRSVSSYSLRWDDRSCHL